MKKETHAYDLEERTFEFALSVRACVSEHSWNRSQWTDVDQVLRSSGSVASNYTEANNAGTRKEFAYRISLAKREASESRLWLRLLGSTSQTNEAKEDLRVLFKEADELTRIFATIFSKTQSTPDS